jgi:hypothetical protein
VLNESPLLRQYVDAWLECKRHFGKWKAAHPTLHQKLSRVNGETSYLLLSDRDGRAWFHLKFYHSTLDPLTAAVCECFTTLVRSPLRERVGKCERCERYFLSNRSYTKKRFCSRSCSSPATATKATQVRRSREREEKLLNVRRVIDNLKLRANDSPDRLERRIAAQAMVTVKWLTRAVNRGEIALPHRSEPRQPN